MIDAGARLTVLAAEATLTAEFLKSFARVDFSSAPGPVPPGEAASVPVAGPAVTPGALAPAHGDGAAADVPAAGRAAVPVARSLDGLRAPVPLASLSRGASPDRPDESPEPGRTAPRRVGPDGPPPAPPPSASAMPSASATSTAQSGGRTFPETVAGRPAPAAPPGENLGVGATWPAEGSVGAPEAERMAPAFDPVEPDGAPPGARARPSPEASDEAVAEPPLASDPVEQDGAPPGARARPSPEAPDEAVAAPPLASDPVEPDGAPPGARARPSREAPDEVVAGPPLASDPVEPDGAPPGARTRPAPEASDEFAVGRPPGGSEAAEAGRSSDGARPPAAAQATAAEAEHAFESAAGPAAPAGATDPTAPRRDRHVPEAERTPAPGAERPPDEAADAPVVVRATAEALPVIRREAVAGIDLRFYSDGAGAATAGLQLGGTGLPAALAFNAAMLPGWPPPGPFEVPDGEGLLARLLGAAHREGSEDEVAGRLAARAGQPSLAAAVLFRLRKLSRARRLRALLGLMALMDAVEAVIEAVEGELLELSRARREAAEDWADAGARRNLRA